MTEKVQPFVIDMRHDSMAESTYSVRETWEEALAVAGEFWKQYNGKFDPTADPMFTVGEGYDPEDLELYGDPEDEQFTLVHGGGDGPFIRIARAE